MSIRRSARSASGTTSPSRTPFLRRSAQRSQITLRRYLHPNTISHPISRSTDQPARHRQSNLQIPPLASRSVVLLFRWKIITKRTPRLKLISPLNSPRRRPFPLNSPSNRIPAALLPTIAADLAEGGARRGERWREELIAKSVAKNFAGAPFKLTEDGAVKLVEELCACRMPYVCPRGKPVMIFTSTRELDRKFDRL